MRRIYRSGVEASVAGLPCRRSHVPICLGGVLHAPAVDNEQEASIAGQIECCHCTTHAISRSCRRRRALRAGRPLAFRDQSGLGHTYRVSKHAWEARTLVAWRGVHAAAIMLGARCVTLLVDDDGHVTGTN
jgi:hypothetical protein